MLRLLALSLVLALPLASRAAPVEISLSGIGVACSGGLGCATGFSALTLSGTLAADLGADLTLTDIHGMLGFQVLGGGAGAFDITGGTIDLKGDGDPGPIASFFQLASGPALYFPDRTVFGPANSFDGTNLWLVGSTFDPYATRAPLDRWMAVALVGRVRPVALSGATAPIPEPGSFALLAAGGLLVGAALRRRD